MKAKQAQMCFGGCVRGFLAKRNKATRKASIYSDEVGKGVLCFFYFMHVHDFYFTDVQA